MAASRAAQSTATFEGGDPSTPTTIPRCVAGADIRSPSKGELRLPEPVDFVCRFPAAPPLSEPQHGGSDVQRPHHTIGVIPLAANAPIMKPGLPNTSSPVVV
jgi:hypothetical protein